MSESSIAYLGVELMGKEPGECVGLLKYQIDELKGKKMKAYFVDIVHLPEQVGVALQIMQITQEMLEKVVPWQQYGGDAICIRLDVYKGKHTKYRAEREMKKTIEDHRTIGWAENVKYKDQNGKQLPVEY